MNEFLNLGNLQGILEKLGSNTGQQVLGGLGNIAGSTGMIPQSKSTSSVFGAVGSLFGPVGGIAGSLIGGGIDKLKQFQQQKYEKKDNLDRINRSLEKDYINIPFNRYSYDEHMRDPFQVNTFGDGGEVQDDFWSMDYKVDEPEPTDNPQEESDDPIAEEVIMYNPSKRQSLLDNSSTVEPNIDERVLNATQALSSMGIQIGSVNTGQHNVGSKHPLGKAFDVPGSKNGGIQGLNRLHDWLFTDEGINFLKTHNLRVVDERFKPAGKVGTANHLHFEIQ